MPGMLSAGYERVVDMEQQFLVEQESTRKLKEAENLVAEFVTKSKRKMCKTETK